MRRVIALAACVVGCATPPARRQTPAITAPGPPPLAPIAAAEASPPARPLEAPPSGLVSSLAITREADAALTLDDGGGVRLWPTLDGTRPPIVVALPAPREAVIGRRATGFAIAARDDAGGMLVAHLDPDGRVTSRVSIAPDPVIAGVVSLDRALIAWRADESIALYGDDGSERARIAVEPGQRIAWVGALRGGALARLIAATDRTLAWGAKRDPGPTIDGELAVSPNGAYLAHVPPKPGDKLAGAIIDLSTGSTVRDVPARGVPSIAFASDDELVVQSGTMLTWINASGSPVDTVTVPHGARAGNAVVAGGGVAMTVTDTTIAINRHQTTQFLGYGAVLTQPTLADGHGGMYIAARSAYPNARLTHFDRELTSTPTAVTGQIIALARIAPDRVLVEQYDSGRSPQTRFELYAAGSDSVEDSATVVTTRATSVIGEATTGLIGVIDQTPTLHRYDAATNTLLQIGSPTINHTRLYPVAPDLAGGTRVVRVTLGSPIHLEWLHDETAAPVTEMTVTGAFADVDRAGHVLVWGKPDELAVFRDGQAVASIPDRSRRRVWPDPRGTRIAIRTPAGISMFGIDGALRWQLVLPETQGVTWLDDDTLAIDGPDSIARVSAATGAIDKLTCGLEFGLHDKPVLTSAVGESLCSRPHLQER